MNILTGLLKPIFENLTPTKTESKNGKEEDQKSESKDPKVRAKMLKKKIEHLKEKQKYLKFRREDPSDANEYDQLLESKESTKGILAVSVGLL